MGFASGPVHVGWRRGALAGVSGAALSALFLVSAAQAANPWPRQPQVKLPPLPAAPPAPDLPPEPEREPSPEPRPVRTTPTAPRPHDDCGEIVLCDYASGAGCPSVRGAGVEGIHLFGAEKVMGLEGWAAGCRGPGTATAAATSSTSVPRSTSSRRRRGRLGSRPSARCCCRTRRARDTCDKLAPARAQDAIDEAPAWCVVGRDECVTALREARRVLDALPEWVGCVERMAHWVKENERREAERTACENAPSDAPAVRPEAPAGPEVVDAKVPETPAQQPEPKPETKPLRVVRVGPGRVRNAREPAPMRPPGDELADTNGPDAPAPFDTPDTSTVKTGETRPDAIEDGRRKGQVELNVAPFSGVLTLRDPGDGRGAQADDRDRSGGRRGDRGVERHRARARARGTRLVR